MFSWKSSLELAALVAVFDVFAVPALERAYERRDSFGGIPKMFPARSDNIR
jgi:hypothetical protein